MLPARRSPQQDTPVSVSRVYPTRRRLAESQAAPPDSVEPLSSVEGVAITKSPGRSNTDSSARRGQSSRANRSREGSFQSISPPPSQDHIRARKATEMSVQRSVRESGSQSGEMKRRPKSQESESSEMFDEHQSHRVSSIETDAFGSPAKEACVMPLQSQARRAVESEEKRSVEVERSSSLRAAQQLAHVETKLRAKIQEINSLSFDLKAQQDISKQRYTRNLRLEKQVADQARRLKRLEYVIREAGMDSAHHLLGDETETTASVPFSTSNFSQQVSIKDPAMIVQHEQQVELLRSAHQAETAHLKKEMKALSTELDDLFGQRDELAAQVDRLTAEVSALTEEVRMRCQETRDAHEEVLRKEKERDGELNMREGQKRTLEQRVIDLQKAIERESSMYESALGKIHSEHEAEISRMKTATQQEVALITSTHVKEMKMISERYEGKIREIAEAMKEVENRSSIEMHQLEGERLKESESLHNQQTLMVKTLQEEKAEEIEKSRKEHEVALEGAKVHYESQLLEMKLSMEMQMKEVKETLYADLQTSEEVSKRLVDKLSKEAEEMRIKHEAEVTKMQKIHLEEVGRMEKEKESIKVMSQSEREAMGMRYEERASALAAENASLFNDYREQIRVLQNAHDEMVEALRQSNEGEQEGLALQMKADLAELKQSHIRDRATLIEAHGKEIQDLSTRLHDEINAMKEYHENELFKERDRHAISLHESQQDANTRVVEAEAKMTQMLEASHRELDNLRDSHRCEIESMNSKLEAMRDEQLVELTNVERQIIVSNKDAEKQLAELKRDYEMLLAEAHTREAELSGDSEHVRMAHQKEIRTIHDEMEKRVASIREAHEDEIRKLGAEKESVEMNVRRFVQQIIELVGGEHEDKVGRAVEEDVSKQLRHVVDNVADRISDNTVTLSVAHRDILEARKRVEDLEAQRSIAAKQLADMRGQTRNAIDKERSLSAEVETLRMLLSEAKLMDDASFKQEGGVLSSDSQRPWSGDSSISCVTAPSELLSPCEGMDAEVTSVLSPDSSSPPMMSPAPSNMSETTEKRVSCAPSSACSLALMGDHALPHRLIEVAGSFDTHTPQHLDDQLPETRPSLQSSINLVTTPSNLTEVVTSTPCPRKERQTRGRAKRRGSLSELTSTCALVDDSMYLPSADLPTGCLKKRSGKGKSLCLTNQGSVMSPTPVYHTIIEQGGLDPLVNGALPQTGNRLKSRVSPTGVESVQQSQCTPVTRSSRSGGYDPLTGGELPTVLRVRPGEEFSDDGNAGGVDPLDAGQPPTVLRGKGRGNHIEVASKANKFVSPCTYTHTEAQRGALTSEAGALLSVDDEPRDSPRSALIKSPCGMYWSNNDPSSDSAHTPKGSNGEEAVEVTEFFSCYPASKHEPHTSALVKVEETHETPPPVVVCQSSPPTQTPMACDDAISYPALTPSTACQTASALVTHSPDLSGMSADHLRRSPRLSSAELVTQNRLPRGRSSRRDQHSTGPVEGVSPSSQALDVYARLRSLSCSPANGRKKKGKRASLATTTNNSGGVTTTKDTLDDRGPSGVMIEDDLGDCLDLTSPATSSVANNVKVDLVRLREPCDDGDKRMGVRSLSIDATGTAQRGRCNDSPSPTGAAVRSRSSAPLGTDPGRQRGCYSSRFRSVTPFGVSSIFSGLKWVTALGRRSGAKPEQENSSEGSERTDSETEEENENVEDDTSDSSEESIVEGERSDNEMIEGVDMAVIMHPKEPASSGSQLLDEAHDVVMENSTDKDTESQVVEDNSTMNNAVNATISSRSPAESENDKEDSLDMFSPISGSLTESRSSLQDKQFSSPSSCALAEDNHVLRSSPRLKAAFRPAPSAPPPASSNRRTPPIGSPVASVHHPPEDHHCGGTPVSTSRRSSRLNRSRQPSETVEEAQKSISSSFEQAVNRSEDQEDDGNNDGTTSSRRLTRSLSRPNKSQSTCVSSSVSPRKRRGNAGSQPSVSPGTQSFPDDNMVSSQDTTAPSSQESTAVASSQETNTTYPITSLKHRQASPAAPQSSLRNLSQAAETAPSSPLTNPKAAVAHVDPMTIVTASPSGRVRTRRGAKRDPDNLTQPTESITKQTKGRQSRHRETLTIDHPGDEGEGEEHRGREVKSDAIEEMNGTPRRATRRGRKDMTSSKENQGKKTASGNQGKNPPRVDVGDDNEHGEPSEDGVEPLSAETSTTTIPEHEVAERENERFDSDGQAREEHPVAGPVPRTRGIEKENERKDQPEANTSKGKKEAGAKSTARRRRKA
eukprot:GHVN01060281.1.p1 GENE.GHVN01060281.1~~GHVN01060281.1.p1  ORF type:complete len:2258 (+),score=466.20 GHVN01060281.1:214-6987(+)